MQGTPITQAEYEEICGRFTTKLRNIVAKKDVLRTMLQLQGDDAQQALDVLQTFLAYPRLPGPLRGDVVVAMQRIAKRRNLLPRALIGVEVIDGFPQHRGGFAEVYRGLYRGRVVCVKRLTRTMRNARDRTMQLCAREAILWGSLNHPNIHQFIGVCELSNHLCLISPWASSGTIMKYLQKYPDANRMKFAADMAEGLKYLHSLSVIHGDIKPANVLIRILEGPRAVLADFGISSLSGEGIVDLTSFSDVCSIGGTVRWQAPELLEASASAGCSPNTCESDIWALGCTFYEILVGRRPYFNIAQLDIKDHVVRQGKRPQRPDNESPAWHKHGLNEGIWRVLEKCWSTEPKDRPTIERVAKFLNWWVVRRVRSAKRHRRYSPSDSEKIAASNRLEALLSLETLLATVGSTNDEPTQPVISEDERMPVRCLGGRKPPRSFPDADKENRAPRSQASLTKP